MAKEIGATNVKEYLKFQKKLYLEDRKKDGGSAADWRKYLNELKLSEPDAFERFRNEAWIEAGMRQWESQPRKAGPDLFSFKVGTDKFTIPEYLTRPSVKFVTGEDVEGDDETKFEKVDSRYATVDDVGADAQIKMRKSAQAAAAAEKQMKAVDELLRLAKGNRAKLLTAIFEKK